MTIEQKCNNYLEELGFTERMATITKNNGAEVKTHHYFNSESKIECIINHDTKGFEFSYITKKSPFTLKTGIFSPYTHGNFKFLEKNLAEFTKCVQALQESGY